VVLRYFLMASGAKIAISTAHDISVYRAACCIGQADEGIPVGLPKSSLAAKTTDEIGFHAATT
jgi:hypothetical protein